MEESAAARDGAGGPEPGAAFGCNLDVVPRIAPDAIFGRFPTLRVDGDNPDADILREMDRWAGRPAGAARNRRRLPCQ